MTAFPTYDDKRIASLAKAEAAILGVFGEGDYARQEPAVLQPAEIFLDRSGEEIRRRTFTLTDPAGNELCLRPDLTIPTVTFTPAAITPGANITVTHVVKNLALAPGNAPLSASRLLLSTDQTVAGQVVDLGTANVPAITAGGMTTVTRSATVPPGLAPGLYYVLARADDPDAIVEPNSSSRARLGSTWIQ